MYKYQFTPSKIESILIGALVAGLAAAMTWALQHITVSDFGIWTPIIVSTLTVLVNALRVWMSEYNSGNPEFPIHFREQEPKATPPTADK